MTDAEIKAIAPFRRDTLNTTFTEERPTEVKLLKKTSSVIAARWPRIHKQASLASAPRGGNRSPGKVLGSPYLNETGGVDHRSVKSLKQGL